MFNPKGLIVLALIVLAATRQISHDVQTQNFPSDGKNTFNLDLIDDSTLDIHYETECKDCKCFVEPSVVTPEKVGETGFSMNGLIDNSYIDGNRIYIIHEAKTTEVSYSVFDVQDDGSLKKLVENSAIPSFQGLEMIRFSYDQKAFIAYSEDALLVNSVDDQGKLNEKKLGISPHIQGKVFDIAYAGNVLFLAKGDLGIELIDFDNKDNGRVLLPIKDLELHETSKITAFEVNPEQRVLYAYNKDVQEESDTSVADFILALDYSKKPDIMIKNNYHHEAFQKIVKVVHGSDGLHVINRNDNKYYYMQFSTVAAGIYDNLDLTEIWRIPFKVNNINNNQGSTLIEGDNYFYALKKNPSYEARMPALLMNVVKKEGSGVFFPFYHGNLFAIVNIDQRDMSVLSINQEKHPTLRCGNFKSEYEEKVLFKIYVYKDACPELESSPEEDDICLYRYNTNIEFTGKDDTPFKQQPFIPQFLEPSNWQQEIDSDFVDTHPHNFPEEPPVKPDEKPEEPPRKPDEKPDEKPEEPPGKPDEKPEEPPGKPDEKPEEPEKPTEKPEEPTGKPEEPTEKPSPPDPWTKPDGQHKPDSSYKDDQSFLDEMFESKYLIVLIGVLGLVLFGCFIKCIIGLTREPAVPEEKYKHVEMPEEHAGEHEEDLEGPDAASEYETKIASLQSV